MGRLRSPAEWRWRHSRVFGEGLTRRVLRLVREINWRPSGRRWRKVLGSCPVDIRLGLLQVGAVMIGTVNAEVFSPIAQRLKRESPYKATMMATLTNGAARSGYIPDDASYGKYTFEVLSSRLRPGCAESSIVNGLLELIESARKAR